MCATLDPIRAGKSYLVLCEVLDPTGGIHPTNTRAELRRVLDGGAAKVEALFGFEQEYTFLGMDRHPLAFPAGKPTPPQGPYYCAVGSFNIYGRSVYEDLVQAALDAGLAIAGANFEVMPGQAEFQIGTVDALTAGDHLWLARWLLHRITEEHGIAVTFAAKPAAGDWNGAGMHANLSTRAMREPGGMAHIEAACQALAGKRQEHLDVYGHGYEERLTGHHETCSHREFRYGVADRTASVRIPATSRRPAAATSKTAAPTPTPTRTKWPPVCCVLSAELTSAQVVGGAAGAVATASAASPGATDGSRGRSMVKTHPLPGRFRT